MTVTWQEFEELINRAGLTPVRSSKCHWRILGGPLKVNVYPTRKTYYINGMREKLEYIEIEEVIEAARRPPPADNKTPRRKEKRGEWTLREKRRMWRRRESRRCHWCKRWMRFREATLEHIIPLFRGGSNEADNLTLACAKCNHERGHEMPELNDA